MNTDTIVVDMTMKGFIVMGSIAKAFIRKQGQNLGQMDGTNPGRFTEILVIIMIQKVLIALVVIEMATIERGGIAMAGIGMA